MKRNTIVIVLGIGVGLCLLTAVFSALAFRTYFSLKKNKEVPAGESRGETPALRLERPADPLQIDDSAGACIRDIRGAEVSLYTYESACLESREEIGYEGDWLARIFEKEKIIPLKTPGGLIRMIGIRHVREYYFDGEKAHVQLNDLRTLEGYPVPDYMISGRSSLGEVKLMMSDIHMIRFHPDAENRLKEEKPGYRAAASYKENPDHKIYYRGEYWPGDHVLDAWVVTRDHHEDTIPCPVWMYQLNGCDDNWIPCKSFTAWNITDALPVQYGMIRTMIRLPEMQSAEFSPAGDSVTVDIVMNGGKTVTGAKLYRGTGLIEPDYSFIVGILGFTKTGSVYMSLKNIKTLRVGKRS